MRAASAQPRRKPINLDSGHNPEHSCYMYDNMCDNICCYMSCINRVSMTLSTTIDKKLVL